MFKRGDIVIVNWWGNKPTENAIVYEDRKSQIVLYPFSDERRHTVSGEVVEPYTGPIYEKDGQRFVPSGENRIPGSGEYFLDRLGSVLRLGDEAVVANQKFDGGYRRILLPVLELESEHEFKISDWVKFDSDEVFQISGFNKDKTLAFGGSSKHGYYIRGRITKLPGRPLDISDLMRVLSGDKVMVECHACECEDDMGEVTVQLKRESFLEFRHGLNEKGENYQIAAFKDGSIVFADGVEGNIFVVEIS